jgi:hypothetical protein
LVETKQPLLWKRQRASGTKAKDENRDYTSEEENISLIFDERLDGRF